MAEQIIFSVASSLEANTNMTTPRANSVLVYINRQSTQLIFHLFLHSAVPSFIYLITCPSSYSNCFPPVHLGQCPLPFHHFAQRTWGSKEKWLPGVEMSNRTFCNDGNVLYLYCPIKQPLARWLLSTWNVASAIEELILSFYLNWNWNSHMWQVATILDSAGLAPSIMPNNNSCLINPS